MSKVLTDAVKSCNVRWYFLCLFSSPEAQRSRSKKQHSSDVDSSPDHRSARHQDVQPSNQQTSRDSPRDGTRGREGQKEKEWDKKKESVCSTSGLSEGDQGQSRTKRKSRSRSRTTSGDQKQASPKGPATLQVPNASQEHEVAEKGTKPEVYCNERSNSRDLSYSPIQREPQRYVIGTDPQKVRSGSRSVSKSPKRLSVRESPSCGSIPLPKMGSPTKVGLGDKSSPKWNQNQTVSKVLETNDVLKRPGELVTVRAIGSQELPRLPQNGRHTGRPSASKSPAPHTR